MEKGDNQEFDVSNPNEVWGSDVTYFKHGKNAYYICAIIDLFSRMVVGYKVGKTNSTQLVKSTFRIAYKKRQPNSNLIFHTDRGGNYRSKTMNDYLRSLNISDDMFDKAVAVNSDAQLYKQAGNGVTIPVVYAVGKRIVEIQNELNKEAMKI